MAKRFSASSAAQLMACPASGNLPLAIPNWQEPVRDETIGAAATGTAVHEIVSQLIGLQYVTKSRTTNFAAKDLRAVSEMLGYIAEVWSRRRFKVLSEQEMKATWLQQPTKTTPDVVFYTQDELHVIDVKWGTIPVEVLNNVQLMFYAVTAAPLAPKAKGVTVHIVQPRAGNMEEWFIPTTQLKQFMDEAIVAESKILAGDTTFGPSDNCTFCPANPNSRGDKGSPFCPAMMELLYPQQHIDEAAMLEDL